MGILDKIEDKLSGNKHQADSKHEKPLYSSSERSLEKQAERQGAGHDGYDTGTSGAGYGTASSGTGYGTATSGTGYGTGYSTTGGRAEELRHPVQTATGGQYGDGYGTSGQGYSSASGGATQGGNYQNVDNDGYGQQSGYDKSRPTNPIDPRSIRGQNTLADSSHGGQGYAGAGQPDSRDYADVDRSHHGGVTNTLRSDQPSSRENHAAIPTAGGEKLGSGGNGSGHNDHHYGRDAASAGGAAAVGEHEHRRGHGHGHGNRDERELRRERYGKPGVSSSDQYGSQQQGLRDPQDRSYADNNHRDTPGAGGVGGYGAGVESGHHGHGHGHYGRGDELSGAGAQQPQGVPTEKKLGGAYEAGYRDAMAHLDAERQK